MGRTLIPTTPHEHGEDVKAFQRLLSKHGWYSGSTDGEYGPLTAQAVYRAKYWLGYPKPDHAAGDVLYAYLDAKRKTPASYVVRARLRQRKVKKVPQVAPILIEARKHLGTRESPPGTNNNPFGLWYGYNRVAWCAMFVTFCAVKVGIKAFQRGTHYSYVPNIVADGRAGHNGLTLVHPDDVRPGDIVCYDWPGESPGLADHVGIFEDWIQHGVSFHAIEGNTSVGNDSNGGEVMRRERSVSDVQAFIRAR